MDAQQFDDLSRFLGTGPTRRGLLTGLGSGLLALAAIREVTEAKRGKRKRKKNKNKKKSKEQPCLNLGDSCMPGGKLTCCQDLICSTYTPTGEIPARCCNVPGTPCTKFEDCCSHFCFEGACLDT